MLHTQMDAFKSSSDTRREELFQLKQDIERSYKEQLERTIEIVRSLFSLSLPSIFLFRLCFRAFWICKLGMGKSLLDYANKDANVLVELKKVL